MWRLQIFDVSGPAAQQAIIDALRQEEQVAVEAASNAPDSFVIVECAGEAKARHIFHLVMLTDPGAALVSTEVVEAPEVGGDGRMATTADQGALRSLAVG